MEVSSQIGPFSIVPEWVLGRDLSATALKLYVVMARFADWSTGMAFPARDTLAERMGCSLKTVDRAVLELVSAECILKISRGRYASALYKVYQVDPRQTDLTVDETDLSSEGTDLSSRLDKNDHLTITTKQEPLNKPNNADAYQPSETLLAEFREKFPHVNLVAELQKFRDHHMAKGSKFSLWDRAFRKWITQAAEWNKPARSGQREKPLTNNQKAALLAMKYREEAQKAKELEAPVNPQQVKEITNDATSWLKGLDDD